MSVGVEDSAVASHFVWFWGVVDGRVAEEEDEEEESKDV